MTPTKYIGELLIIPAVGLLLVFILGAIMWAHTGGQLPPAPKVVYTETTVCYTNHYSDGQSVSSC